YKVKAQFAHPDKGGDPQRFKRILKAYDYLKKVKGPKGRRQKVIKILELEGGKKVYIQGKSITTDEAHEIIIRLTGTWGTDFEKQELRDAALGLKRDY
ncbi:unnamed protein product, partial [marine sediment metagenome]